MKKKGIKNAEEANILFLQVISVTQENRKPSSLSSRRVSVAVCSAETAFSRDSCTFVSSAGICEIHVSSTHGDRASEAVKDQNLMAIDSIRARSISITNCL